MAVMPGRLVELLSTWSQYMDIRRIGRAEAWKTHSIDSVAANVLDARWPEYWTHTLTMHGVSQSDWESLWVKASGDPGGVPVMGKGETNPGDAGSSPAYPDWRCGESVALVALEVQDVING